MYYKIVYEDGIQIGQQENLPFDGIEITEAEYNEILEEKKRNEVPPTEPKNPYGISDETYNSIIDDYTASITEEVANSGY